MEVKLIVTSGKNAGQEIPVAGPKFFIGRAEDCHLRPHSDQVSRHHCAILVEQGMVAVRDFGSKNGTFVNGQRVKTEHELKMGDHLKVGPLDFEVRLIVEVKSKKKPKVKSIQEAAARTVQSAESTAADGDDLDLSDWLGEESEEEAAEEEDFAAEAGAADAGQTETSPTDTFAGLIPPGPTSAGTPEPGQQKEAEGEGGQAPPPKKPVADSSRSAAADVLKEFFKRK